MDNRRLSLHEKLCEILDNRNAHFQPPKNLQMRYPAIRYSISRLQQNHANDKIYKRMTAYEVILIDEDPESKIANLLLELPYCSFDRCYVSDNLNHFTFTLYY